MQVIILDKEDVSNIKPGKYLVSSDDPRYFSLISLPNSRVLDSRSAEDGRHTLAIVEIGTNKMKQVSNPPETRAMGMDPSFFSSAKREYINWQDKWWREAIQNSVDAGATDIICKVIKSSNDTDTKYTVICEDNGKGMDRDVLIDKFLAFGASGKRDEVGKTGGFGKAKELLLLPWINWTIWTGDLIIKGKGNTYIEERAPSFKQGVVLVVTMGAGADDHTKESNAINVITRSYLPHVKFTVNGKVYRADLEGSKTTVQPKTDKAEMYVGSRGIEGFEEYGIVRVNGLYMHSFYIGEGFEQIPIIEVTAPSIEVLSVSRDSFRDYDLRKAIDEVIKKIMIDKKSALKKKENLFIRKYKGRTSEYERDSSLSEIESLIHKNMGKFSQPTKVTKTGIVLDETVVQLLKIVSDQKVQAGGDSFENFISNISGESAEAMMEIDFQSESHMEYAVKSLIWQPSFYIENEIPGYYPNEKFFPETMSSRIYMLAKTWLELVRFVNIQMGGRDRFMVGFIFSRDYKALYRRDNEGDQMILLNPFKFKNGAVTNDNYTQSSDDDLRTLYALAIHECTHMIHGLSYHDEAFASAMTEAFAMCMPGVKKIQRIVNGIRRLKDRK